MTAALEGLNESGVGDTDDMDLRAEAHFEEFNLRALDMVEFGAGATGPRVSIAADDGFLARKQGGWSLTPIQGIRVDTKYLSQ